MVLPPASVRGDLRRSSNRFSPLLLALYKCPAPANTRNAPVRKEPIAVDFPATTQAVTRWTEVRSSPMIDSFDCIVDEALSSPRWVFSLKLERTLGPDAEGPRHGI
jgi:hypothetical protein